jgi:hypothetical protein
MLISPALADEPDGPDDVRPAPPQEQQPPPPPPAPVPPPQMQPLPPPPPMLTPQSPQQYAAERAAEADKLLRSGRAMKAGGAFMLAMGIALELTGLGMTFYSQLADPPICYVGKPCDDPRTKFLISGSVLDLAGGGLIGGGLPVMFAGVNRINRARRLKLHLSFGAQEVRAQAAFTF